MLNHQRNTQSNIRNTLLHVAMKSLRRSLALLAIATVAAFIPARRSMRMAPVDALRAD